MIKELGIDLASVSATPEHELGSVVYDNRGGNNGTYTRRYNTNGIGVGTIPETVYYGPGKKYMYVRADAAIAQYDACELKLDETDAPFAVIKTAGATSKFAGICELTSVDANDYFWMTIQGNVQIANVADASVQGDYLSPSATAGRLDSTALIAGDARVLAVSDGSAGNQANIFLF